MPKKKKEAAKADLLEAATERLGPEGENQVADVIQRTIQDIGKVCTEIGMMKHDGLLVIGSTFLASAACSLRLANIPLNEAIASLSESYEHLDVVERLDNILTVPASGSPGRQPKQRQPRTASAPSSQSKARNRRR